MFLSRLDELDGALPGEDGVWQHVRFESRRPQLLSTHFWMVVFVDCMFLLVYWIDLMAASQPYPKYYDNIVVPVVHFAPLPGDANQDIEDKSLLLNFGFDSDSDVRDLKDPLLFYAGEAFPIDACLPVMKREWRLYGDLGIDPEKVFIVIYADHRCPHGAIFELMQLVHEAGFRRFRLRVKIDPYSMAN